MNDHNIPIVVGIAQYTQRVQENPLEPIDLIKKVCLEAIENCDAIDDLLKAIDALWIVNFISHSYEDAPATLAEKMGITPKDTRYTTIGGNTPQYLVNQAALALEKGEHDIILIAGGETYYSLTKAQKTGATLNWSPKKNPKNLSGDNRVPTTSLESQYKMYIPSNIYPLYETALRAHLNHSPAEHQSHIGHLYERLSKVAAKNPYAWTQQPYTAEEITEPTTDNRYVAYPYTKRMNANIFTDQSAALVVTTTGKAKKLGIPESQWVFIQGGAHLNDVWELTKRPKLYTSEAIQKASQMALDQAGLQLDQVAAFDLYSCFPSAVQIAQNAIGISNSDQRPISLTGGLAYFGGPGNNYAMHSIVEAVKLVREEKKPVMVTALGWYITKHAIGIYSKQPPSIAWQNMDYIEAQTKIDNMALGEPVQKVNRNITVEAYTILYNREGQAEEAIVIGRTEKNERCLAILSGNHETLNQWQTEEIVGKIVPASFNNEKNKNFISL